MSPTAISPRAVAVTCACALVAVVAPLAQAHPAHPLHAATAAGSRSSSGDAASSGPSAGSVVVQAGDTLSAIAARAGVSVAGLAGHNGLVASAPLPAGRALALPAAEPGGAAGSTGAGSAPAGAEPGPGPPPATTATRVTAGDVGSAAAQNGVPTSLARAIAWQESGFDNGAVSSAGARGVMQVMPGTWTWIAGNLSPRALDPTSAADNVQAGTLYLRHLLRQTGGDADQAAAAYYQGLASVRRRGMYDDTKRYVENVRALRSRFGG